MGGDGPGRLEAGWAPQETSVKSLPRNLIPFAISRNRSPYYIALLVVTSGLAGDGVAGIERRHVGYRHPRAQRTNPRLAWR
jgi:hypothetical protein